MNKFDVIIVGAGPAGIFSALKLKEENPELKVLIVEKGKDITKRICPKRKLNKCVGCRPCSITSGWAGAGAYSDGKLSLSPDVGGTLPNILGYKKSQELIKEVDDIYLSFGADKKIHGIEEKDKIKEIKKKSIENNFKLIECPVRHLGTEEGYRIYSDIQKYLIEDLSVEVFFNTSVIDLIIQNEEVKGVTIQTKENTYDVFSDKVILAVGREGSEWLSNICKKQNINTQVGIVDIGVRVEVRDEIMQEVNEAMYESKLVYHTPTFDDKVRVFCSNPSGEVATEYYDDGLAVVNGHAYKSEDMKTNNTNFALLVSKQFTEPFNSPIEYGKAIASLGNMLSDGKIIVQRYGDFKKGRRTTEERLYRNNITPTLKDAIPGDLCLVLPYRIMKSLDEMIIALDKIIPGMSSDETLLYGVEVKFYSNKLLVDDKFRTNIKNLYAIGDGVGITRGLIQASANGYYVAKHLYDN